MPKIKTHKSASKRFYITGSGKLARNKAYKRHLLISKNSKTKRRLSKKVLVSKADLNNIKKMIPGI